EVADQTWRVEQPAGVVAGHEPLPDRDEPAPVVAELDGALDILLGARAGHLADARGMHQAGADPRREGAPGKGQDRHPHPHRARGWNQDSRDADPDELRRAAAFTDPKSMRRGIGSPLQQYRPTAERRRRNRGPRPPRL